MKKLILILALFGIMTFSANSEVPKKVSKAFEKRFEGAKNVSWEQNGSEMIVRFELGHLSKKAIFDEKAKWITTTTTLDVDELRRCLVDYVDDVYVTAEIAYAEMVEDISGGEYYYVTIEMLEFDEEELEDEPVEEAEGPNKFKGIRLVFDMACNFLEER